MYLIRLSYRVPLEKVDQYLAEHRAYLDGFYQAGALLVSGPEDPRIGGVIIALFRTPAEVEDFVAGDPFYKHGVSEYQVTSFSPVKFHDCLSGLLRKP